MKFKQFWRYALAPVVGLLLSSSVYGLTFTDDFTNLANWTLYGSPSPLRLASVHGKSNVFDNNGDATGKSGAISIQTFGLNGGFTIRSEVYLDFTDTYGCNAEAAIGVANPTIQGWGGYDPHIYLSISAMGEACGTISDSLRGHAYFFGSFTTPSGTETFGPTEENPARFRANEYANGWHRLKIVVSASSQIKFYVDTILIYTGLQSISNAIATGAYPIWIGSQSSGDAGKAYHDLVTITTSCEPPSEPILSSPSTNAIVCNSTVAFVWNEVVGATEYEFQVDNNSDFSSPESYLAFTPPTHSVSVVLTDNCLPQYWRVRAKNACGWSGWSLVSALTVCSAPMEPTLDTPANNAISITQPVALNWNDIAGISRYRIQVDTAFDFASPVIDRYRTESIDSVSGLAGSKKYFWHVRAANGCATSAWSSTYNFTTAVCIVPDAAVLLAPATGDSGLAQPITLNWSDAARALSYRVQVDNDSDFSSTVIDNQQVTPSTLDIVGLVAGTKFYWRVRTYNNCGWSDWSDTSWFKTCDMIEAPVLVTPRDGERLLSQPVLFAWGIVAAASKYQIQIDDTVTFVSPVVDDAQLVEPHFGTYDLVLIASYYWRVRAYGTCGWGAWSPVRSFVAPPSAAVEEIAAGNLPETFSLSQNHPNPFNPSTTIEFQLPRSSFVTLDIYDILGRQVNSLVSEFLSPGFKQVVWDGCDANGAPVSSGVYFYRLTTDRFVETKKMLMLK